MKNVRTLTKAELEMMKENMDIYVSEGYTITAQKPVIGNVYHNFLENVDYCATENDTDKVLLIGTVGEPWFAPIKKVLKQYSKQNGEPLTETDITNTPIRIKRLRSYNAAIQLQENTCVTTQGDNILYARKKDYLVCSVDENEYGFFANDEWGYWTINEEVFNNTNQLIGGKCGDDIKWSVDKNNTLTISGTGKMYDYDTFHEYWGYGDDDYEVITNTPWFRLNIKTVIIKYGVENISNNAFYSCNNIENVIISNTVTSIGHNAFCCCTNLKNIAIPNSVTSIGTHAFEYCRNLTSIIIPDGVTYIENATFFACDNLTNIIIPNSIIKIEDFAFSGCKNLRTINIPDSVTEIGRYAFSCCYNLISVKLSNNITKIKHHTFEHCGSLTDITIPDNIEIIEDYAFEDCPKLFH